jgi:Arc/MetJ family transcription regulator
VVRGTRTQRTTVELDQEALERAREVLGTKTIRETIDRALREVQRFHALRRGADLIRAGSLDLVTPGDLVDLRTPPE